MNIKIQNIFLLVVIYVAFFGIGTLLIRHTEIEIEQGLFVMLLTAMTVITLGAYLLLMAGMRRKESAKGFFLLTGIGGKFLAYLIMILIFWKSGKKLETEFIIAFFVLYLVLTIFLIKVLYKYLKIN